MKTDRFRIQAEPGVTFRFADGSQLGHPSAHCDPRIAANWLRTQASLHSSFWPKEFEAFDTPKKRHELLQAWQADGPEGILALGAPLARDLHQLLKPYILTNALGPSFDGAFSTIVPVITPPAEVRKIAIQSGSDVSFRSWILPTHDYLEACANFIKASLPSRSEQ